MPRNLRNSSPRWLFGGVLLACCACSAEPAPAPSTAGSGGTLSGGGAGGSSAGGGGQAGSSAGSAQGGASGGGGATGTSGSGGSGGGVTAGSGGGGGTGGAGVLAGCANNNYPICIDFESGIDAAVWAEGSEGAIVTDHFAHGAAAYHAYPDAQRLLTTQLGVITNVLWGRFYLHMSPGAPGGHGNIMAAHEGSNWYEIGWQFNGLMGVWHWAGGENPLRSMPTIVDQWYCVEFIFDGTTQEMQQWFVDGTEVSYYMGEPNNMKPELITQFDQLDIGFTSYAGLGLNPEPYGNNDPPVLEDMWLDDIAFDVKRIGCITQ